MSNSHTGAFPHVTPAPEKVIQALLPLILVTELFF